MRGCIYTYISTAAICIWHAFGAAARLYIRSTAFACNVKMYSTTLANPDKQKDYAYLRNGAADFFAGANPMYDRRAYNEMQGRNLTEKLDASDITGVWTRSINRLHEEVESAGNQLRVLDQSIVEIHSMQDMYTKELQKIESQRVALAEEIRGIETQNMRPNPGSFR